MGPDIVLVHGLWHRSWALKRLARLLRKSGHEVHLFNYPTLKHRPEHNAAELLEFCRALGKDELRLVGYSLGGLVILAMLPNADGLKLDRIVFLGTPLNGSQVVRRLSGSRAGRRLLGQSAAMLASGLSLETSGVEIGMIAGTKSRGLGRLPVRFNQPNDGTVAVAETHADWLTDWLQLNVSHFGLIVSREVARQAGIFLTKGSFEHPDA